MPRKLKHLIQMTIMPFFISLIVRFIYLSNKKIYHHPSQIPSKPFILGMWHGELLMQPFNYQRYKPKGKIKVIVSQHRDGIIIRRIVKFLGIDALSGSSTRGGAKVLIGAIKNIKNGNDIAITPDGPKGPRHSIANGIIAIAQKTNSQILFASTIPSKYWQLNSWDKFIIPKPFGTIHFYISQPIDISNLSIDKAKEKIQKTMMQNILNI